MTSICGLGLYFPKRISGAEAVHLIGSGHARLHLGKYMLKSVSGTNEETIWISVSRTKMR